MKTSDSARQKIKVMRREIDRVDKEIVSKINARAKLALKIGKAKETAGIATKDSAREADVLNNALSSNKGLFGNETLLKIIRLIVNECTRIQDAGRREIK